MMRRRNAALLNSGGSEVLPPLEPKATLESAPMKPADAVNTPLEPTAGTPPSEITRETSAVFADFAGAGSEPVNVDLSGRSSGRATARSVLSVNPEPLTVVPTLYPAQPSGPIVVDNYITINANSIEAREFFTRFDALLAELKRSNEISGEIRDQLKSEMDAGKSLLSAPKVNRSLVEMLLVRPLKWLAEKAGSAVITKLAGDALEWLLKLL
jgi:hypothetical protein